MNSSSLRASAATATVETANRSNMHNKVSRTVRRVLLDVPLFLVTLIFGLSHMAHQFYLGPMQVLIETFRRSGEVDDFGYYTDFIPDITYYGRQCDARDVSTTNSNDLIVPHMANPDQAADIMMTHGAVLVRNILSNETATQLREYLETRNVIRDQLSWDEMFWGDIGRLALGLGTDDTPIIAKAMEEVGQSQTLRNTLTGILGPDPAIVEISTLTAMHGCQEQGIHTDSDFFGSSLLYSRTFLHSYTLFMALQDTTSRMGSTTVCPGTHWCANEDLTEVCHANGAFEVSSNGQTGIDSGMLYKGDGMMFNQNVWHRGPKNWDVERPMNRVMFIVTFVSRKELEAGDIRQQGLGTYYYMRWNMWGHTFEDLKHAASTFLMSQPWAALKAIGLFKWPDTQWGIPWLEHFARQLANKEDFYSDYELEDFVHYLDSIGIPRWLRENKETKGPRRQLLHAEEEESFERYLKQLFSNATYFVTQIYLATLGIYFVLHFLYSVIYHQSAHTTFQALQRALRYHIIVGMFLASIWYYVNHVSYLGQRIQQRNTWKQPFPQPPDSYDHLTKTTMPTRQDILVGSRFDAPYLASFNHVLDYHPGNIAFTQAMEYFATSPVLLQAYLEQPVDGIRSRFLQQDYKTGFWSLMEKEQIAEYIRNVRSGMENPVIAKLDEHLKIVLADARFGLKRDIAMTSKFTPSFVKHWQSVLFQSNKQQAAKGVLKSKPATTTSQSIPRPTTMTTSGIAMKTVPPFLKESSSLLLTTIDGTLMLRPGDVVQADFQGTGEFWEARIHSTSGPDFVTVEYTHSTGNRYGTVPRTHIRPFRSIVQGDVVEADFGGQHLPVRVVLVHPLGHCTIEYPDTADVGGGSDGDAELFQEDLIPLDALRFPTSPMASIVTQHVTFEEQQIVLVNYRGSGEWFHGEIQKDNEDGSYAILYEDGDFESNVPSDFMRPLST